MSSRKISNLVGALVGLVGLGFVIRYMWERRDEIVEIVADARPAWLVVALAVGVLGMSVIGWSWLVLVRRLGSDMPVPSAQRGYFVGQLGKYVPGGVWAVVGRGEGARQAGVPGAIAYSSTMLSMATAYVAGALVAVAVAVTTRPDAATDWLVLGVMALGPLGLLGLHPKVFATVVRLTRRLSKRELALEVLPWPVSLGIVARQLLAWLGIGTATWLTSVALGGDLSWSLVLLATCVSWVAGFLFLPVPGGIGIREAAFISVLGLSPLTSTVALAARLLFVVVDLTGAASATSLQAVSARQDSSVSPGSARADDL